MEADGEFSEEVKRERELAKIRQVVFSIRFLTLMGELTDPTIEQRLITILGTS